MIGLDADITPFKRLEEIMMYVAAGTSNYTGDAFFRSMVKNFAAALGVRMAFVTECMNYPTTRVRALAFWDTEGFRQDVEYDLAGTPCERVITQGEACFYRRDVASMFPKEKGLESYFGLPILDGDERVIGHLAFFDDKAMNDGVVVESIFKIFTARAAAEIARTHTQNFVTDLVKALSEVTGQHSFQLLVKGFAQLMGVREAFVTACTDGPERRVHVLAWWRDGQFEGEREYALAGSVCEETVSGGILCIYTEGVSERFPRAKSLRRESYVGLPCFDGAGLVIGHIACCHDQPLRRELPDQVILQLFAERAALELERRRLSAIDIHGRETMGAPIAPGALHELRRLLS